MSVMAIEKRIENDLAQKRVDKKPIASFGFSCVNVLANVMAYGMALWPIERRQS